MVWTHEKKGTGKIAKESYGMDPTRKKEKRKTIYHLDRRNSDYIEGTRNLRRSLYGHEDSIISVIFGSGKCVNIVKPEIIIKTNFFISY